MYERDTRPRVSFEDSRRYRQPVVVPALGQTPRAVPGLAVGPVPLLPFGFGGRASVTTVLWMCY